MAKIGSQHSSSPAKAPMSPNASQKTTTAPPVKMPSVSMVRDNKPRTSREQAVDAWNRANPAHSGKDQFQTMLEREWSELANKRSGSESVLPGKPKQAQ